MRMRARRSSPVSSATPMTASFGRPPVSGSGGAERVTTMPMAAATAMAATIQPTRPPRAGSAEARAFLPNVPIYVGGMMFFGAVTLDAGAPSGIRSISNAAQGDIVP